MALLARGEPAGIAQLSARSIINVANRRLARLDAHGQAANRLLFLRRGEPVRRRENIISVIHLLKCRRVWVFCA